MHAARAQALHGPLLQRALRPSAMLPPSMADVSIEIRHAAFVEASDCFAAMIPVPVRPILSFVQTGTCTVLPDLLH